MKIALTGAAGHIGNNLCRALIGEGYDVRALIYKDLSSLEHLKVFKFTEMFSIPSLWKKHLLALMFVYHIAGKISVDGDRDGKVTRVNVEGTKMLSMRV